MATRHSIRSPGRNRVSSRNRPSKTARSARPKAQSPAAPSGYSESAADRLRAYLASVRPLQGVAGLYGDKDYQRGRSLIERLALSARKSIIPTLKLSPGQCANVLRFIANSEPVERDCWWRDPKDAPSHVVGFIIALDAMADSLCDQETRS